MPRKEWQAEETARRLDQYLAAQLPGTSRSQVAKAIVEGRVWLNDKAARASQSVKPGDTLAINWLELAEDQEPQAEAMPLSIVYEDTDLLVIDKPRGLVVHPAPGHSGGTLVNALLAYCPESLSSTGGRSRPGIVHRIDKDTSGLLLVVKNDRMHRALAALLKGHEIRREYQALIYGVPREEQGLIDAPIGRDPVHRQRMAVVAGGREARTWFRVGERFPAHAEVFCRLETGRTHQIRVHLRSIGHPVVGDPLYAPQRPNYGFVGQALHAFRLSFRDPRDGQEKVFTAPPPEDYQALKERLKML